MFLLFLGSLAGGVGMRALSEDATMHGQGRILEARTTSSIILSEKSAAGVNEYFAFGDFN